MSTAPPTDPLYEYVVVFRMSGIDTLSKDRARELAAAFGRALDRQIVGVRLSHTSIVRGTVRCVYVAPHPEAVYAAAREAHLAMDAMYELGPAQEGRAPQTPPAA